MSSRPPPAPAMLIRWNSAVRVAPVRRLPSAPACRSAAADICAVRAKHGRLHPARPTPCARCVLPAPFGTDQRQAAAVPGWPIVQRLQCLAVRLREDEVRPRVRGRPPQFQAAAVAPRDRNPTRDVIRGNIVILRRSVDVRAQRLSSDRRRRAGALGERRSSRLCRRRRSTTGRQSSSSAARVARVAGSQRRGRTPSSRGSRSSSTSGCTSTSVPACDCASSAPARTVAERISSDTIGGPRRQSPESSQRQTDFGVRRPRPRCCARGRRRRRRSGRAGSRASCRRGSSSRTAPSTSTLLPKVTGGSMPGSEIEARSASRTRPVRCSW